MKKQLTYEWVRSGRKTVAIQIRGDGEIVVRTPFSVSRTQVEQFLEEKRDWIVRNQKEIEKKKKHKEAITEEMRRQGIQKALKVFPERVEYYARLMKVSYGKITIREQKTRWGSCSAKGNLNFNWKLVLTPPEILDYVVVHELAHRREMNHSKAFWEIVEQVLPDYRNYRKDLRRFSDIL